MGKTGSDFHAESYAPVAQRIRLFYRTHPAGRIETQLVSRTDHEVVFKALIYRNATDDRPAATGWAAEREGDGEINVVACLENTETSAIGRALANLGFTASQERPSAEEIAKASRARGRIVLRRGVEAHQGARAEEKVQTAPLSSASAASPPADERAMLVSDLLALINRATPLGIRPARLERWKALLSSGYSAVDDLVRCERRLRSWIARRIDIATL